MKQDRSQDVMKTEELFDHLLLSLVIITHQQVIHPCFFPLPFAITKMAVIIRSQHIE
jgi:hypothetical protein